MGVSCRKEVEIVTLEISFAWNHRSGIVWIARRLSRARDLSKGAGSLSNWF